MNPIPRTSKLELERSTSLCGSILAEATRLSSRGSVGTIYIQLLHRASDLLDEIDEVLLSFHFARDHPDFAMAAELHRKFEACLEMIPSQLRGHLRRARRVTDD